jgi:hypothetical protein
MNGFTGGSIFITFAPQTGSGEADLNGLQIVSTSPEPCSLVILATGLLGLLAYAWRKRR